MAVERMACGCLTSTYRDAGERRHQDDCIFTKDSSLMKRMYWSYRDYIVKFKDGATAMTYDEWLRCFKFKD